MNFIARAFERNFGPQPSVSTIAVDGQNVVTNHLNDRVDIRAGASNRRGYAEATGLNNSTVFTLAGDDAVRIQANARGLSTNAWAMRNSKLDVGTGNDTIELRASTRAGAFDPAYGAENSTISSGHGRDNLRIYANARGNTTGTIAAYGTVNSQINTGADNDRVDIRANATNRSGYAEAVGLDSSTLETESGDDLVRIHANARGLSTNAWAIRNSTLDVGSGNDKVDLRATTRAGAFDPAYGALNSSISSGIGKDSLRIHANASGNTNDTIAAYGALNSQLDTGSGDDRVEIRSLAANRRGIADAVALDGSSLETEAGDDLIRVHAGANGKVTQAWALRDSKAITGPGADRLRISSSASGKTTGTINAYGTLDSQIDTGSGHDRVDIRANANNRKGLAEAAGLDASSLATDSGDDLIRIHAHANGKYTNAWAMRDSILNAGSGNNSIDLRASTHAFGIDPAYGVDSSSIVSGNDQDNLRINANASGNTAGSIAAYGAVNSQIDLGGADNKLLIDAKATNRLGTAQALGLESSSATTGSGNDLVRVRAFANGRNRVAWAMRNSTLDLGAGDDRIDITGNALQSTIRTGDGLDTIRLSGLETDQLHIDTGADDDVLKIDGGTRISYTSGDGSDQLQLTRNYFASLIQSNDINKEFSQGDQLMVKEATIEEQNQVFNEPMPLAELETGLNLHDALKFEDFTTGEGGDSVNVDDILIGYGVNLKHQSIFADGYLSFQQNGNDSILFFDADGADHQDNSDMALVVFKGVQASAFRTDNLDSTLVNQDDFILNQGQQQPSIPAIAFDAPVNNKELGQALSRTSLDLAPLGIESVTTFSPLPELEAGSSLSTPALEAATDSLNPFGASPSISDPSASLAQSIATPQASSDFI